MVGKRKPGVDEPVLSNEKLQEAKQSVAEYLPQDIKGKDTLRHEYEELIAELDGAVLFKTITEQHKKADLYAKAADAIERLVKEVEEWELYSLDMAQEIGKMLGEINNMRVCNEAAINDIKYLVKHPLGACDICSGKHCEQNILGSGGCNFEYRGVN